MDVKAGRYTANYPDDFVVFFIGMRINELRRVSEWVPVMRAAFAMTRMGLAAAGEYRNLREKSTMRDRVGKTDAH